MSKEKSLEEAVKELKQAIDEFKEELFKLSLVKFLKRLFF